MVALCDRSLLEPENPVDALDKEQNERLPGHQPPDPIEQLAVENVRPLPWVAERFLEIDLFLAVGARLLFADYAPASDAELVESKLKFNERT